MKVSNSAGKFELTSYTDGYPISVNLLFNDVFTVARMSHKDLSDLEYAVKRHRELLRAESGNIDNNEI